MSKSTSTVADLMFAFATYTRATALVADARTDAARSMLSGLISAVDHVEYTIPAFIETFEAQITNAQFEVMDCEIIASRLHDKADSVAHKAFLITDSE